MLINIKGMISFIESLTFISKLPLKPSPKKNFLSICPKNIIKEIMARHALTMFVCQ